MMDATKCCNLVLFLLLPSICGPSGAFDDASILSAARGRKDCVPSIGRLRYLLLGTGESFFDGEVYAALRKDPFLHSLSWAVWRYSYDSRTLRRSPLCTSEGTEESTEVCAERIDRTTTLRVSGGEEEEEVLILSEGRIKELYVVFGDSAQGMHPTQIEEVVNELHFEMMKKKGVAVYYVDESEVEMYKELVHKADRRLAQNERHAMVFTTPVDVSSVQHDIKASSCLEGTTLLQMLHLQDLSQSFKNDLPNIKKQMPDVIANLTAEFSAVELSLASFIDRPKEPYGGRRDYCYQEHQPFSSNVAAYLTQLNKFHVRSGRDWREAQLFALQSAAESTSLLWYQQGFPGVTLHKIVLIVTDSGYHSFNPDLSKDDNCFYPETGKVASSLTQQSLSVIFLVTRDVEEIYTTLLSELERPGQVQIIGSTSEDFDIQLLHSLRRLRNLN